MLRFLPQSIRVASIRAVSFALTSLLVVSLTGTAAAQIVPDYSGYQPVPAGLPPGLTARWAELAGRTSPASFQPVRVELDGEGEVTVYHSRPVQGVALQAPAQFAAQVGHSYRLKITGLPGLPGVELYPTIEVIDRLHPPTGHRDRYPVPIHITRDDINLALDGSLVTHVVYLEQPQFAAPFELDESTRTRTVTGRDHALEQADRFGRPLLIFRLGSRLPNLHGEPDTFYGSGGPVLGSRRPQAPAEEAAP